MKRTYGHGRSRRRFRGPAWRRATGCRQQGDDETGCDAPDGHPADRDTRLPSPAFGVVGLCRGPPGSRTRHLGIKSWIYLVFCHLDGSSGVASRRAEQGRSTPRLPAGDRVRRVERLDVGSMLGEPVCSSSSSARSSGNFHPRYSQLSKRWRGGRCLWHGGHASEQDGSWRGLSCAAGKSLPRGHPPGAPDGSRGLRVVFRSMHASHRHVRLRIDGGKVVELDTGRPASAFLRPGTHKVELKARGFAPRHQTIEVPRTARSSSCHRLNTAPVEVTPRSAS